MNSVRRVGASCCFHSIKFGPFLQHAKLNHDATATPDEKFEQMRLARWAAVHNFNFKVGAGKFERTGAKDRNQMLLQTELFSYQ